MQDAQHGGTIFKPQFLKCAIFFCACLYVCSCCVLLLSLAIAIPVALLRRQSYPVHTIMVDGVARSFIVFVPSALARTATPTEAPLLLGLHGGTGSAQAYARRNGFVEVAERYGAIAVFPDGLPCTGVVDALHCWNSGTIDSKPAADDLRFLQMLVTRLLPNVTSGEIADFQQSLLGNSNLRVDWRRIYLTGHSNGALMAYRMAGSSHGNLFAAVAPVSGAIGGRRAPDSPQFIIDTPVTPITVLHVHGLQDDNVPMNSTQPHAGFLPNSIYIPTFDGISFFLNANNCTPSIYNPLATRKYANGVKSSFTYYNNAQCSAGTDVMTLLMDASHAWVDMDSVMNSYPIPSSPISGLDKATSLAEVIWLIISTYSRQ